MWRIVGARKSNSAGSCIMPVGSAFQRRFFFHQHIMTVLEGDEVDLSAHFIRAPEQETDAADTVAVTASNKRKALAILATDKERASINERVVSARVPRAKFLEPFSDSQLRTKAQSGLESIGLIDGYSLGRLTGADMYASWQELR